MIRGKSYRRAPNSGAASAGEDASSQAMAMPSSPASVSEGAGADPSDKQRPLPRGMSFSNAGPNASKGLQTIVRSVSMKRSMSSARIMVEGRTLDTSKDAVALRDQRLKKAIVREPLIVPAAYGQDWALDLLAIGHNAVRIEVQDLYKILSSLSKRRIDLLPRDFTGFYTWFNGFHKYVARIMACEEAIVFAWFEENGPVPRSTSSKASRDKATAVVTHQLALLANMEEPFSTSVDQAKLDEFFMAFDTLSATLMDLYRETENLVPAFAKRNCDEADKSSIESQLIKGISKGQYEILFTVSRGISANFNAFPRKYIPPMQRFNVNVHRRRWDERVEIVQAFVGLQKEYEKVYRSGRNPKSM